MFLPKLTGYQTLENSHGTLDPLGLYSIADRLANKIAPDLRERMKHPRYLTAIAVGSIICETFGEDNLAADEISPAWQVYEWYVVSALFKRFEKDKFQLNGLPGSEKTKFAKRDDIQLNANRYLKTPSVFGFHGVYKTLAKGIELTADDHIGEFGIQLVDAWEAEQGLQGFRIGVSGTKGKEFRSKLLQAIDQGMVKAAVAKPWSWEFYTTLAESLAPRSPGKNEAKLLFEKLSDNNNRKELIHFLISKEGQVAFNTDSEREFHNLLLLEAGETKTIIRAIQAYEKVCRLLFNAFYETMQWMMKNNCKGSIPKLVQLVHVQKAFKELPVAFRNADEMLAPFANEAMDFLVRFQQLRDAGTISDWLKLLFEHHTGIQKIKPPNGKASWILEHSAGNYLLNNNQALNQDLNEKYVHQYRTYTLQSFMKDLGKINE